MPFGYFPSHNNSVPLKINRPYLRLCRITLVCVLPVIALIVASCNSLHKPGAANQSKSTLEIGKNCRFVVLANSQRGLINNIQSEIYTDIGVFSLSDDRYNRSIIKVTDSTVLPHIPWTVITARDKNAQLDIRQFFKTDGQGRLYCKLDFTNRSKKSIKIHVIYPFKAIRNGDWNQGSLLKFETIGTYGVSPLEADEVYNSSYILASNKPSFVAGFLSTNRYIGTIRLSTSKTGLEITACQDAQQVELPAGSSRSTEILFVSCRQDVSSEAEVWAQTAASVNRVKIWPRNFATWCSWYSGSLYQDNLNGNLETLTRANVPLVKKHFQQLGLECMRVVDDSAKRGFGDWPLVTDAIPGGYARLAGEMTLSGIRPGFWFDVHRIGVNSKIFSQHPEWLARDVNGPLLIDNPAYGKYGLLDASVPDAQTYYMSCAKKFRDAGYRYCFTDFIGETGISPLQSHDPQLTTAEVSRNAISALRQGFGEDFYYLCQQSNFSTLGLVESMRTGEDSFGDNIDSYRQASSLWFLNHRLLLADPDAWCPLRHDYNWDRCWGSWQLLGGFPITIGADFRKLTSDREELIKRMLPALNQPGRPRDIWERRAPMLFEQNCAVKGHKWRVVGLFNFKPYAINLSLNLDRLWDESKYPQGFKADPNSLGLTNRSYLVYDYWEERFLGKATDSVNLPVDANCGHRVLVICEDKNRPQLISVGNHIGQGLEELEEISWNEKTLGGITHGRRGMYDTDLRIYVPDNWFVKEIECEGNQIPFSMTSDQICRFTAPDKAGKVRWAIRFGNSGKPARVFSRAVNPELLITSKIDSVSLSKYKNSLPQQIQTSIGPRYADILSPNTNLVLFSRPGLSTAEWYDQQVGFGLIRGTSTWFWEVYKSLAHAKGWLDQKAIVYRVDNLKPDQKYRIGLSVFARDKAARSVEVAVTSVSNNKKYIVANELQCRYPEANEKVKVEFFDLPQDAIDPAGMVIQLGKLSGPDVSVNEIWLTSNQ